MAPFRSSKPAVLALPVAGVFGAATLATMLVIVTIGCRGLNWLPHGRLERYTHACAGAALTLCGLAMTIGL